MPVRVRVRVRVRMRVRMQERVPEREWLKVSARPPEAVAAQLATADYQQSLRGAHPSTAMFAIPMHLDTIVDLGWLYHLVGPHACSLHCILSSGLTASWLPLACTTPSPERSRCVNS